MKLRVPSILLAALWGALLTGQTKPAAAPLKEPLPELWLRAQAQPVEIAAYVFKQLSKAGKMPPGRVAECKRALSEKALGGSGPWYPRLPAVASSPAGYSGRLMAFFSGLDRLGIYVEAGAPQATDPTARWLEFLATSLSRPRSPVTCTFPTVEIGRTAFQRVALLVKERAVKEPEKVETVVSAAQQYVGSPWEIGGFLEIIEALPEGSREVHWNRIGGLFRTLSPQPTGSVLYLRNAEFFSALQRMAAAKPGDLSRCRTTCGDL